MTSTEVAAVKLGFSAEQALAIEQACLRFGIDTGLRKCHFLAQVAHESACGRYMEEIASGAAYEGRNDLGNTQPGDGKRFKGRGLIQLTGRDNYLSYSRDVYGDTRCITDPSILSKLPDAALAAGWFWAKKGINRQADDDNIEAVTRKVNGGLNGLADRKAYLLKAKALILGAGA